MADRLTDEDYLEFLDQGYVVIRPRSLSAEFHGQMWQAADNLYAQVRQRQSPTAHLEIIGDNLRAAVPALDELLNDPAVDGAVTSILGEGAFLHPHNFVHISAKADQPFHQDGNLPWNERGHYRAHRPDWLIFFYYPQAVTLDNGPTEIVPHSQYWTTDIEKADGSWRSGDMIDPSLDRKLLEADDLTLRDQALAASLDKLHIPRLERRFIEVPAGSVVIGNYDLIHRGTRTTPGQAARYMYKFYFARTREPTAAAWDNDADLPRLDRVREDLRPIVRSNWAWSRGVRYRQALGETELAQALDDLHGGTENARIAAAYRLGSDTGEQSLAGLVRALHSDVEGTRRAAAYGLRLRCDEAGQALEQACRDERVSVRRFAAFALGAGWSAGADVLIERLEQEDDDLARSNAAYALGQIARNAHTDSDAILAALIARLKPGVEPDNTDVAGMSRSTVRQSAAYAVLQAAANHVPSAKLRAQLKQLISVERDRYVMGMLIEALAQHSPDADLIRTLAGRRWNAL